MMMVIGYIELVVMSTRGCILELMMVDMDLGLKRPATFHLTIQDKILVVMRYLDICPRPATLPTKTQVVMVYF